jgi:hypothetical protein
MPQILTNKNIFKNDTETPNASLMEMGIDSAQAPEMIQTLEEKKASASSKILSPPTSSGIDSKMSHELARAPVAPSPASV